MASNQLLAGERPEFPDSLWASITPPLPPLPSLEGAQEFDVAIVGGGFTGLMAALTLRAAGRRVAVLEAVEPGWGASGRNNGQVIPGFKWDPDVLRARYGPEAGRRLALWGAAAPDLVFETIAAHGIECSPVRNGWIQPAYTDVAAERIEERCRLWAELGAPVAMLPRDEVASLLGTPIFQAAWIDRRGGCINPLAYARGLARAAQSQGVGLYARTPVESMRKEDGRWVLACANGATAAAPQVIVATAAYANDIVGGLRTSMVPVRTAQVATAPLPQPYLDAILPQRHCASDTRRLLTSFRISPDHRLVMGGAGATAGLSHDFIVRKLHKAAARMFGHLGPLAWEYAWSGYFAVTKDHMPHIHETGGDLICALGCNGRGIAVSTAMGKLLGERLLGLPTEDMPLRPTPIRPFAFHAFRHLGVAVATQYNGLLDYVDKARSR